MYMQGFTGMLLQSNTPHNVQKPPMRLGWPQNGF
jgi:hypothetical protein